MQAAYVKCSLSGLHVGSPRQQMVNASVCNEEEVEGRKEGRKLRANRDGRWASLVRGTATIYLDDCLPAWREKKKPLDRGTIKALN